MDSDSDDDCAERCVRRGATCCGCHVMALVVRALLPQAVFDHLAALEESDDSDDGGVYDRRTRPEPVVLSVDSGSDTDVATEGVV